MTSTELVEYNRRWVRLHQDNLHQREAARRIEALCDALDHLREDRDTQGRYLSVVAELARTTDMPHREVMEALGFKAERDRLAAIVDRVREMADTAPPLMTRSGYVAGVVSASALRTALEGTDS